MTDRLREYIREVHEARNKMGCIPRYEKQFKHAADAWLSGWYQGMLDEALEMIPDAVLHGWMDEEQGGEG